MKVIKVHCLGCIHFYVTWDSAFPRGCRAMGFKCREMPSAVVLASSGTDCLRFEPKRGGAARERGRKA